MKFSYIWWMIWSILMLIEIIVNAITGSHLIKIDHVVLTIIIATGALLDRTDSNER